MAVARTLPWDWHPGRLPENADVDASAYIETTYSFLLYRSEAPLGLRLGRGASLYKSTMLDVGRDGQVVLGAFALVHGARIICDAAIDIGDYALISWNVVLMDTYRVGRAWPRTLKAAPARPVRIGRNVWIGFEACVLPGVTIGEGAVVGARAVVAEDVPAYTVVAGNPARVIRSLSSEGEVSNGN
jgi:acetyltransferase-like isoleucine patch superfamily enzyme